MFFFHVNIVNILYLCLDFFVGLQGYDVDVTFMNLPYTTEFNTYNGSTHRVLTPAIKAEVTETKQKGGHIVKKLATF
mgnify:CR=1 FL=1